MKLSPINIKYYTRTKTCALDTARVLSLIDEIKKIQTRLLSNKLFKMQGMMTLTAALSWKGTADKTRSEDGRSHWNKQTPTQTKTTLKFQMQARWNCDTLNRIISTPNEILNNPVIRGEGGEWWRRKGRCETVWVEFLLYGKGYWCPGLLDFEKTVKELLGSNCCHSIASQLWIVVNGRVQRGITWIACANFFPLVEVSHLSLSGWRAGMEVRVF